MPEAPGRDSPPSDDLLSLFDAIREQVRAFGRSPAFLAYMQAPDPSSRQPLIHLTRLHVPSASFLPVSFLIEELDTLVAHAARRDDEPGEPGP